MMKKVVAILLISVFGNSVFSQKANFYSKEIQDKIKQVENNLVPWAMDQDSLKFSLEERMAQYKIPGLSIAVIKDYKIEWVKAYGMADISENRAVTTKTLFQAASLSKSLNAVGVLKLVQEKSWI